MPTVSPETVWETCYDDITGKGFKLLLFRRHHAWRFIVQEHIGCAQAAIGNDVTAVYAVIPGPVSGRSQKH